MSHPTAEPATKPASIRRPGWLVLALVLDFLVVAGFAIGGRRSHDVIFDFAGLFDTAWPFLIGLTAGWIITAVIAPRVGAWPRSSAARHPVSSIWPAGVMIWLSTWALGILLRVASGDTASGQFPLVTGAFLVAGFLGWRLIAGLIKPRQRS